MAEYIFKHVRWEMVADGFGRLGVVKLVRRDAEWPELAAQTFLRLYRAERLPASGKRGEGNYG